MVQNLVHSDRRYLLLRGATYYFRFPTPTHARRLVPSLPREVKRSLKTDSLSQARALVGQKLPLIRLIYQCCDKNTLRDLYGKLLDFNGSLNQWVEKALRGAVSGDGPPSDQLLMREDRPFEGVGVRFSEAWRDYKATRNWRSKVEESNRRCYEALLHFIGDKDVGAITKKDIKSALARIAELPQRNRKPYRGKSLEQLAGMPIPEDDRVSGKSVREHLKLAQSLFSAYLTRDRELLPESPTHGVSWQYSDRRYACLSDAQVRELLVRSQAKPKRAG